MDDSKKTCFVSGHMDLSKEEFAQHYEPAIRREHAAGSCFVVGDARGCDFMAQRLLHGLESGLPKDAGRVRVFHMLERPRHSFGSGYGSNDPNLPKDTWSGRRGGFALVGGFTSDDDRDAAMTQASTDDIAWVRPVSNKRNSGTAKNLRRRELKRAVDRAAVRATWPVFNVNVNEVRDEGAGFLRLEPAGEGYGKDTKLPLELVVRLTVAQQARRAAQAAEDSIESEVRALYYEQENDRVRG